MRTFKDLFAHKMNQGALSGLYEAECHVCAHTVRIFEKLETEGLATADLAETLAVNEGAIIALQQADHCDPRLVIRLCRHLGLTPPPDCPKVK